MEDYVDAKLANITNMMNQTADLSAALATQVNGFGGLMVQLNGPTISLFGGGSRYSLVHRELGVPESVDVSISTNVANSQYQHGTQAGAEMVRLANPNVIFVVDRGSLTDDVVSTVNIFTHPIFNPGVDAVVNQHVFFLDSATWYMASGGITALELQIQQILDGLTQVYNFHNPVA